QLLAKGLPAEKVRTIYNGCAAPVADVGDRAALGLDAEALVIVFAGRLAEGKGVEHLISAVARVDGVQLAILGEGPMRSQLEAQAGAAGIDARFAGFVADPMSWYLASDAVALPSKLEALPMTLIEAAACGRPVIATRVGGIPEIVTSESGILVDYGDVPALAQAIDSLRDDAHRVRMGAAARAVWEERFGLAQLAENLGEMYRC
ncbi:MAG: glycosyltransferase family 4 protein, partial [Candidatus Hydrogenedentales bacterium]